MSETTEANTAKSEVKKPKKRLFYLDFVRVLSVAIILLTHFNNPFFTAEGWLIANQPFNIYIGGLGVSLFLMISGTALTVNYRLPLDLKSFYKKRFLGIYPMFWMAYALAFVYELLAHPEAWLNPAQPLPWKYFPLTIAAMDGVAANFNIPNMYILGEWFLGFIVIFYLFFPLLLWGVHSHPWVSGAVALAIYVASFFFFTALSARIGWSIPAWLIITTRLPELLFGMYFAVYWHRVRPWALIPAVVVLVASSLWPQIPEDFAVTGVGISAFVILVFLGEHLDFPRFKAVINNLSKYSYAIFLVHHVIIIEVFKFVPIQAASLPMRVLAFGGLCVLSYIAGVGLYHLHSLVMGWVFKLTDALRARK